MDERALHARLEAIDAGVRRLREEGWEKRRNQFRVEAHRFELAPPASERDVAAFEAKHGVRLPEDYRAFLLHVGAGGAGPYYGILPLAEWWHLAEDDAGSLSTPSPLRPHVDYDDDWRDALGVAEDPYCGLLSISEVGCGGYCALVLTGEARGRVLGVHVDGYAPMFAWDASFLDWYERWLDEASAHVPRAGAVGTRGGSEADLIADYRRELTTGDRATLVMSMGRRGPLGPAGIELLREAVQHPEARVRVSALTAMSASKHDLDRERLACLNDDDSAVRAEVARGLTQITPHQDLLNAALARETRHIPMFSLGNALADAGCLALSSLRAHAASDDVERRRTAAWLFARTTTTEGLNALRPLFDDRDIQVQRHLSEGFGRRPSARLRRWIDKWTKR